MKTYKKFLLMAIVWMILGIVQFVINPESCIYMICISLSMMYGALADVVKELKLTEEK